MSNKKNPLKKTGRKGFVTNYEPLFDAGNRSVKEQRRSNSLTPDKNRRQTIPGEIPNILKRNIAALSESTESIKLTDFGKSFVADISSAEKTPPKKKQKSLFDRLQYDDSQNIELVPSGFENKRLNNVRTTLHQHPAMISSPSMFEIKPSLPRSPEQKFPSNTVSYAQPSIAFDTFDKLKLSEKPLNESKVNSKVETIVKDNSKDEGTPTKANEEKLIPILSCLSSNSAIIPQPIKLDENFISDMRENMKNSLNHLRQMVNNLKSISAQIFVFRQELADGLLDDFPSTPDE